MQLDNYQKQVVDAPPDANMRVIGAPGSGKTRALVKRYANLYLKHGLNPKRILVLTYSRKAAKEMADRISASVDISRKARGNISTINAFCHRLYNDWRVGNNFEPLKVWQYGDSGLNPTFKAANLMAEYLGVSDLSVFDLINKTLKSEPAPRSDLLSKIDIVGQRAKRAYEMWIEYEKWMKGQNLTDFYGQVWNVDRLMHQNIIFAKMVGQRFDKIICDEMQDSFPQTYRILLKLAEQSSIELFGDPSQLIYGFNGAEAHLFFEVEARVKDMITIHLANNYRSHKAIVEVVNDFGPNTSDNFNLMNCVQADKRGRITIGQAETIVDQGDYIAEQINKNSYTYKDVYVLARTNAQCSAIYQRLLELAVPAYYAGNYSIWDKSHMKAGIGYAAIMKDQDGPDDLMNVLNVPSEDYKNVYGQSRGKYSPTRFLARKIFNGCSFSDIVKDTFKPAQRPGVADIVKFVQHLKGLESDRARVSDIGAAISKWAQWTGGDPMAVEDDLSMLWDKLENFDYSVDKLRIYIQKMNEVKRKVKAGMNKVQVMTIHQAKGLEAPTVFLTGLSEPVMQEHRSSGFHPGRNTNPLINEENCLYYVGISRTIQHLYLTYYLRSGETNYELSSFVTSEAKGIINAIQRG